MLPTSVIQILKECEQLVNQYFCAARFSLCERNWVFRLPLRGPVEEAKNIECSIAQMVLKLIWEGCSRSYKDVQLDKRKYISKYSDGPFILIAYDNINCHSHKCFEIYTIAWDCCAALRVRPTDHINCKKDLFWEYASSVLCVDLCKSNKKLLLRCFLRLGNMENSSKASKGFLFQKEFKNGILLKWDSAHYLTQIVIDNGATATFSFLFYVSQLPLTF